MNVEHSIGGNEQLLRRYLLGNVSPQEQDEIAQWLMSDDSAYDLLTAAEDDLIEEHLRGLLERDDEERFSTHFLAAPERRNKLAFSRSLHEFIDKGSAAQVARTPEAPASKAIDFFRLRPAWGLAASVLLLVGLAGASWSALRVLSLQRELLAVRDDLENTRVENQGLKRRLEERPTALVRTFKAFLEKGALERAQTKFTPVDVPPGVGNVEFYLPLDDTHYETYRAVLRDDGGTQIWSSPALSSSPATRKTLIFQTGADLLMPGDYSFVVTGLSPAPQSEALATYLFRITRS